MMIYTYQLEPNTTYMQELDKLLKQRNSEHARQTLLILICDISPYIQVYPLRTQYKFTDRGTFRKLYSTVSGLSNRYKKNNR